MNEDSQVTSVWKNIFYQLQQEAPKPSPVICTYDHKNKPPQYGREFHGAISRVEANRLLNDTCGRYLIRESWRGQGEYTLAIVFDSTVKNFKLYYEDGVHFVGEKRFESVYDLVADGLIFFHVESRGAHLLASLTKSNYEDSPYYQSRYYTLQTESLMGDYESKRKSKVNQLHRKDSISSGSVASSFDTCCIDSSDHIYQYHPQHRSTFSTATTAIDSITTLAPAPRILEDSTDCTKGVYHLHLDDMSASNNGTLTSISTNYTSSSSEMPGICSQSSSPASSPAHIFQHCMTQNLSFTDHPILDRNFNHEKWSARDKAKTHSFKTHNFKGLHWCDFCAHFLWGLIGQGVKCADCGFKAHRKCSEKVPADCLPVMNCVKRSFGVDLTTLLKAQNRHVPSVLERCLDEMERRGLESEGLYRVAGLHDDVEKIKVLFDKDPDAVDISPTRYDDINTLSSVVKAYLRQLPIPLITFDTYAQFLHSVGDQLTDAQKVVLLEQTLNLLPQTHYQTLKYFINHLQRVAALHRINMMSAENLAIVLTPAVIRSPDPDPLKALASAKFERLVVEHFIINYYHLFRRRE